MNDRRPSVLFLTLLMLVMVLGQLTAQEALSDKKKLAKEYMLVSKYREAYSVLSNAHKNRQEDKESNFLMGLCLYHLNRLNDSELIFKELLEKEKAAYPETLLYLGRIAQDRNEFKQAAEYYKLYLKSISGDNPNRASIRDAVRQCSNGLQVQFRQPLDIVENLGSQINSEHDEFGPVMSPNYSDRLYFSSSRPGNVGGPRNRSGQPDEIMGRYTCDIFSTQLSAGKWNAPTSLNYLLNSPKHEVLLDFSQNGRALYYFKGNTFSLGQILIDSFRADQKMLTSDLLLAPVDGLAGISAPHIVNDTLIIFPSQRPGGYGGLDLYRTSFSQGRWTPPQNLGPEVNSPYDETTPFLARDGKTLYFSSNNPQISIGGFDILKTVFNIYASRWTPPFNLGLPVNSAGDDTHFRLSRDGYTAFFSSSRKDGLGERDLYAAYFFDFLPEMTPPEMASVSPAQAANPGSQAPRSPQVLTIKPLLFNRDDEVLSTTNLAQLNAIIDLAKQQPGLQVLLIGYSKQEMAVSSRLFSGMKTAEIAAGYLIKRGIAAENVRVRGTLGADLQATTRGIDFFLIPPKPADSLSVQYDTPIADEKSAASMKSLRYRLLAATSSTVYRGTVLAQAEYPIVEKNMAKNETYLYLVGQYATYSEAEAARRKLSNGGQLMEIIPFVKENRLAKESLKQLTSKYPDLEHYLGRN